MLGLLVVAGCGRFDFEDRPDVDAGADGGPDGPPPGGRWEPTPPSPLAPRVFTSAVWTGSDFLVFGGALDTAYNPTNTGARFDPNARTWTPVTMTNAPPARHTAKLGLVGDTIVEYGGGVGFAATGGGGRYQPSSDTWLAMGTPDPGARIYAATAVAGGKIATWGGWSGPQLATGGMYDPVANAWTTMSTVGAPSGRSFATMVWTGTRLIVWGGCDGGMPSCPGVRGDGAAYDPATDTWTPISSVGAPQARAQHGAVWTGSEMIVWGGCGAMDEGMKLSSGAAYSPATDTWRPIAEMPGPRVDPGVAWLGDRMVMWGGDNGEIDGWLYDPVADHWERMAAAMGPTPRSRFAFAANDHQVFVWGGSYTEATGAVWTRD